MAYVYRALSKKDILSISLGKAISSKTKLGNTKAVKVALIDINSHLLTGTTNDFCWISCSKGFSTCALHYGHAGGGVNRPRTDIAIVDNHSTSVMATSDGELFKWFKPKKSYAAGVKREVWELSLSEIKKMVFDVSSTDKIRDLIRNGLIINKGTKEVGSYSGRVGGYAVKSLEVLVYNEIPNADIVGVLNPMQADMLFPHSRNTDEHSIENKINTVLNHPFLWSDYIDDKLDYRLLYDLYYDKENKHENKNLHDIAYEIYKENKHVDILALYNFLNFRKKKALASIFENKFDILPVERGESIEDNLYAMRIGNYLNAAPVVVDYKGINIKIDPLSMSKKSPKLVDFRNDISLLIDYRNIVLGRINHADVYVLDGGYVSNITLGKPASSKNDINDTKPLIKELK